MTLKEKLEKRDSEKKSRGRWLNLLQALFWLAMLILFGTRCVAELIDISNTVVGVEAIQVAIANRCWVWFLGVVVFAYHFDHHYKEIKG